MKPSWGWVALGVLGGIAVGVWAFRPNDSSCCDRLAKAAADKIDGYLGGTGVVSGALNATGLSSLIPGLLDDFGVPK